MTHSVFLLPAAHVRGMAVLLEAVSANMLEAAIFVPATFVGRIELEANVLAVWGLRGKLLAIMFWKGAF